MGLSSTEMLQNAFEAIGRGQPINRNQVSVTDAMFFHRQAYAGTATTLEFFSTVAAQSPTTNWPSAGGLPKDQFLWITHLGFAIHPNTDVAGAAVSNGDMIAAASATPYTNAEQYRVVGQNCLIEGFIGQYQFAYGWGMENFPTGSGFYMPSTEGVAASAGAIGAAPFTFGVPHRDNRFAFEPWQHLLPQEVLKVKVGFPVARTVTNAVVVMACVWGKYIRAANR